MKMAPTLAAAAALLTCGAALAQSGGPSPWYVGLTQDVTRQSNVFNAQEGSPESSSTVSTTTLRGGINAHLGRQRAFANASAFHQRYSGAGALNNDGYNFGAGLDWETIGRLSGTVSASSDRRLADLNTGIATANAKNLQRSDEASLRARLGGESLLGLDGSVGHRRVTFSAPEFAARQYRQNNGSLGLSYRPSGSLTLGTGVSAQRTEYLVPQANQTAPDASERRDVYLSANWVPTGASTLTARVNIGKTEYDRATGLDFDGITGSLGWVWRPSGLVTLSTTVARDTGQDIGFLRGVDGTSPNRATDFSRVTDTLSLLADYQLTGKVSLTGGVAATRRDLVDPVNSTTGSDRTNTVTLGARWAATRSIATGCNASHAKRSASGSGTFDYTDDRFGCFVSLTID